MTFQKFVSFLTSRQFHYSRLDQLEDTLEGINQRHLSNLLYKEQLERDEFIDLDHKYSDYFFKTIKFKELEENLKTRQRNYYVQCWITSERESAGMWNLYSESGGIALKISLKNILEFLDHNQSVFDCKMVDDLGYGLVDYKNYVDRGEVRSAAFKVTRTAFRKDVSFIHENEFRICLKTSDNQRTGIKQSFEKFEELPIEIVMHPKSSEWQIENVRKLVQEFGPKFRVKNSELRWN